MKDLVKKLLTNGADPNVRTKTGTIPDFQTPLHLAIVNRHRDVVKVLLEHKSNNFLEFQAEILQI